MLPLASFFGEFTAFSGGVAASMAVGAFIGQAAPSLSGAAETQVRKGAAFGGLLGLCFAFVVVVLSALIG